MAHRAPELKQTDGASAATIRNAVGERLRTTLAAVPPLPSRLEALLEQLRLRDSEDDPRSQ